MMSLNPSSNGCTVLTALKAAILANTLEGLNPSSNGCTVLTQINSFFTLILHSLNPCLLYTSPSPRDATLSRMPSSA